MSSEIDAAISDHDLVCHASSNSQSTITIKHAAAEGWVLTERGPAWAMKRRLTAMAWHDATPTSMHRRTQPRPKCARAEKGGKGAQESTRICRGTHVHTSKRIGCRCTGSRPQKCCACNNCSTAPRAQFQPASGAPSLPSAVTMVVPLPPKISKGISLYLSLIHISEPTRPY